MQKSILPLTSVRFFAALAVVFAHFTVGLNHAVPGWLANAFTRGFVGVNLFFILSGFILTYNYKSRFQAGTTTIRAFLVARFARLYPVYLVSLIILLPRFAFEARPPNSPGLLSMVAAHLTLNHAWFAAIGDRWNGPAWSIGTEWWFYLAYPLLIPLIGKVTPRQSYFWIALVYAVSWLVPYFYMHQAFSSLPLPGSVSGGMTTPEALIKIVRWWPIIRIPEFIIGALAANIFLELTESDKDRAWKWLGPLASASFLLVVLAMVTSFDIKEIYLNQVLLTLPFTVLICALAFDRGHVAEALRWAPLVLLGEASYSLYMIHMIPKHAGDILAKKILHVGIENTGLAIFLIVVSVLLSIVSYKWVEVPARKWIVKRFSKGPSPTPVPQISASGTNP